MGSISPLGSDMDTIWNGYLSNQHFLVSKKFSKFDAWVSSFSEEQVKKI